MKRIAKVLHLTAVLVLAAILVPLPTAMGEEEVTVGQVWSQYFEGEGHVVVVDESGVYMGLRRSGDASLIKYAADGQLLWTRDLGDIGGPLKVAVNDSTLYVTGRSSRLFTPDLILQAFSTDGLALWNHRFETELADEPVEVAADASGVYVVGRTHDRYRTDDPALRSSFVQKYDEDGNQVWARTLATPWADSVSGVELDASGVYVVGKVAAERAVWKFGLDGQYAWARQFKIGGGVYELSVAADASGVYVAGATAGALPNQTSTGAEDAFIRKYSSDGDELWTRQFGAPGSVFSPAEDTIHAIAVTEHGVYVGGTIRVGTLNPYSGPHTACHDSSGWTSPTCEHTRSDAFVRKFSASGDDLWGLRYGGSVGALDIAVGETGIYLTRPSNQASSGYLVRIGETPGPPRDLQPTPGEAHVSVAWLSPDFNGGLPIEEYRIYRGTDPASLELVGVVEEGTPQTYLDRDVTNLVTYYYAVSAVNEIGEGARSPTVATTPGTPPVGANPGPPPLDAILYGSLAVLGAAIILAIYRLRRTRSPGRDPDPAQYTVQISATGFVVCRFCPVVS